MYTDGEAYNYFDKTHPVVSSSTGSPASKQCLPPHTQRHAHSHTHSLMHTRWQCHREDPRTVTWKKIIYLHGSLHERGLWVKRGLPRLCSGQSSAFCVCHLQSKCTWTRTWGFLGNQSIEEQHNGDHNYPPCSKLLQNRLHSFVRVRLCACVCACFCMARVCMWAHYEFLHASVCQCLCLIMYAALWRFNMRVRPQTTSQTLNQWLLFCAIECNFFPIESYSLLCTQFKCMSCLALVSLSLSV